MSSQFASESGLSQVRKIIVIVVNARSEHSNDWGESESPPGMASQLMKSSGVPIERYAFETLELMKDRVAAASMRRELRVAEARLAGSSREEAEANFPEVTAHVLEVSFDNVSDPQRRSHFQNMPTSFVLPEDDMDQLREVAGELLRQSLEYQSMLKGFHATPAQ